MPKKGKKKDAAAEREAEDARRLAEEERSREEERARKERDATELKYKELISAFFHHDIARLTKQIPEFESMLQERAQKLEIEMAEKSSENEWNRYLECSILPSPKIERDLNTYLMLWAEEPLRFSDPPSLTTLYAQLPAALTLLHRLEAERALLLDKKMPEKAARIQAYATDLVRVLVDKWDETTQEILHNVDQYPRETAENFQTEGEQEDLKLGIWANLTKNPRHKVVEFPNCAMACTVAKPLGLDNVGMRMIYCRDPAIGAPFEAQEGSGDRMSHVGGILFFDLMQLPDPPKKIEKWIIRPILSTAGKIARIDYPFKKPAGEVEEEGQEAIHDTAVWLIQLNYAMQPNCIIDKSARIMFWDYALKAWSREGIKDDEVDSESGRVSFRTMRFAPYAICQNTYLELPYKDWEMAPTGPNECTLRISGQANEIKVVIRDGMCQLLGVVSDQHKALQSPYPPSLFFKKLSQIGLNFSGPKSLNGVDIGDWVAKQSKAEKGCIEGISCAIDRMAVRKSSSNGQISSSKCVFQFQEVNKGEEWKSVVYNIDYKMGDETFPLAFVPKSNHVDDDSRIELDGNESKTVNSTVYHALCSAYSADEGTAITIPPSSPLLLLQTVAEVLQVTRILAFS